MACIIRRRERKDCGDIARVVTESWQDAYRGIIADDVLDGLPASEGERARKALDRERRREWGLSPVTRRVESKKKYSRKQKSHADDTAWDFCLRREARLPRRPSVSSQ